VKLLPYGPRAVLVEFDDLRQVMAAATTWRVARLPGVVDVVPAARTVLVQHDGSFDPMSLPAPVEDAEVAGGASVTVPVRYDGDDLTDVATACGLTTDEVIRAHCEAEYAVAFCGFMPGFSYLVGLDERLVLPRRPTPRTRVPAGSVAIASTFSAIYPGESPGGWHLLGHTDLSMWDESRDLPATLPPGTRVRFEPA
jgi:KipI family sensor histidine kinase inhibitor